MEISQMAAEEKRLTNRQKQALETKKLLEDTGRILLRKGIDTFRIEDLTKECGVSKGTFYHYFENKDQFVLHLSMDVYVELEKELERRKGEPVREQLRYYVEEHTKSMVNGFTKQYYLSVLNEQNVLQGGADKMDYDQKAIEKILQAGINNGELKKELPVTEISRLIFVALCGRSLYWLIQKDKCDPMKLAEELLNIFFVPAVEKYYI
ncbi:MAG: TetR/AcrR family transcriptional regulator [Lachnospiraceae bacterium]|nr:TetR/AcrR family transcriptional regulator [Lachnospiraceae bacterium]